MALKPNEKCSGLCDVCCTKIVSRVSKVNVIQEWKYHSSSALMVSNNGNLCAFYNSGLFVFRTINKPC